MLVKTLISALALLWSHTLWAQPNPIECLQAAAQYHGVHPYLLLAVLSVESGLNPKAVGKNTNGTYDLGLGQINSMHLPELRRHGVHAQHLMEPCKATYVTAWYLRKGLDRHGRNWFGAASYHSTTPVHNARYQRLLRNELERRGIAPNTVWWPLR